ncbi:MAG: hypothetical protein ACE5OZ_19915 [Candidatus Heimdallarchaeota archaeon]
MLSEDQKEVEKALKLLEILRNAKTAEIPLLYEQWLLDSPQVEVSHSRSVPLIDLLVFVFLSGGIREFKDSLDEARELTLSELVRLCELSIQPVKFDKRDVAIIRLLFQDPLRTRISIAEDLELHRTTVAQRILRLTWTNAIRSYPLPDWHYFGITKMGFRYKCLAYPEVVEKRCYSRLALWETSSGPCILDNWNCPVGQEQALTNEYLALEAEGEISDLEIRRQLSLEKILSITHFLKKRPSIPHLGLEMKRRIEGRFNDRSKDFPILRQKIAYSHPPDFSEFDLRLLSELWLDFLLSRSRAEVAKALGVSAPTVSRRVQEWKTQTIVVPSLQIGFQGVFMRQGPIVMDVGLRIDVEMKDVLESLLELFPRCFLYEIDIEGTKKVECYISTFPEMRGLAFQLPSDLGMGQSFKFDTLAAPSALRVFDTYNYDKAVWETLGPIFTKK